MHLSRYLMANVISPYVYTFYCLSQMSVMCIFATSSLTVYASLMHVLHILVFEHAKVHSNLVYTPFISTCTNGLLRSNLEEK